MTEKFNLFVRKDWSKIWLNSAKRSDTFENMNTYSHVWDLQQNTRGQFYQGLSASLTHWQFISPSLPKAVGSFCHTLFLSLQRLLRRVLRINFVSNESSDDVYLFVTFYLGVVTMGSEWSLMSYATLIDYLEWWCYTYLRGTVALLRSAKNPGCASVYFFVIALHYSFKLGRHSSWLAGFCSALDMLFRPLTSFTICYAILHCLFHG